MKKALVILLAFASLLGIAACGTAPAAQPESPAVRAEQTAPAEPAKEVQRALNTLAAADLNGKIKLFGRTSVIDKGIACDFSASGFEFKINCEGDVIFHVTSDSSANTYFRAYLDGAESERRYNITGKADMTLFKNVAAGEHTITFVRDTSVNARNVFVEGITMTCDPATLQATPNKDLLIEFVGTSNTCASGVLCIDTTTNSNNEAATRGYAYLTAKALDTDWMTTCKGSIGITKEVTQGNVSLTLRRLYDTAYGFRDPDPKYEWTRHPDIVVLEIGPNDKVDNEAFIEAALEMANHVRELHPGCKLMLLHAEEKVKYKNAYPVIVEKLGGAENKVWDCTTPDYGRSALDGIHRNVEENQKMADYVTSFIRDNVLK